MPSAKKRNMRSLETESLHDFIAGDPPQNGKHKSPTSKSSEAPSSSHEGPRPNSIRRQGAEDLAKLAEAFGQMGMETIEDVYIACGRNVNSAAESLLAMAQEPGDGVPRSDLDRAPECAILQSEAEEHNDTTGWNRLPREVKAQIFSRLDRPDLARMACTCRSARDVARTLRRNVKFLSAPRNANVESLIAMWTAHPNARSLSLSKFAQEFDSHGVHGQERLLEALEALFTHIGSRIEALHIRSSLSVIDATVFTICSHENATSIETLDLSYCENISDNSLSALSRLKRPDGAGLRELYLSGCQGVTGRGISTLMSGAMTRSLSTLDVSRCNNMHDLSCIGKSRHVISCVRAGLCNGLRHVELRMRGNCTLKELHLPDCNRLVSVRLEASGVESVNLSSCKTLEDLMLDCASLQRLNLSHCKRLLQINVTQPLQRLRTLTLQGCHELHTISIRHLLSSPNLNAVNAEGCTSLESLELESAPSLQKLDLSGSHNLGRISICESALQTFHARGCRSLEEVFVSTHSDLESVDVTNCRRLRSCVFQCLQGTTRQSFSKAHVKADGAPVSARILRE